MMDTHDAPADVDALDVTHHLIVLRHCRGYRPRLDGEWPLWVEWLRRGDELHVHLAEVIEAHFTRTRGRPRDAIKPDLRLEVELEQFDMTRAAAIKEVAARHKIETEALRKRLRRGKARDR